MHRHVFLRLLTLLCMVTQSITHAEMAFAECIQPQCQYLPFVSRFQPVQIDKVIAGVVGRQAGFMVFGSVINTSAFPVRNVTIRATLLNRTNGVTETVERKTALAATLPGQSNPFTVTSSFPVHGGYINTTSISIVSWTPLGEVKYANPMIETKLVDAQLLTFTNPYPTTHVYGTLRNNTGMNLKDVQVVAWSVERGQVGMQPPIPYLGMGQTAPYSITFYNTYDPISPTLKIVAQGIVVP